MNPRELFCDFGGSVAKSKILDRLDSFATLATRLDSLNVAVSPLDCHACHICHPKNELASTNIPQSLVGNLTVFQWLSIIMKEGHLEPSQPSIGQAVGWPQRLMQRKSFWVEFCCWCRKNLISKEKMPEEWTFYELLDRLFIPHEDKYEVPILENCREAFTILRHQYECD